MDSVQRTGSESDQSVSELDESLEESGGEEHLTDEDKLNLSADEDTVSDQSDEEDITSDRSESESADNEQEPSSPLESTAEGDDITMMSLASLQEDLEKGKAVKHQVGRYLHMCGSELH